MPPEFAVVRLRIPDVHRQACENHVETALRSLAGVQSVAVDVDAKEVAVSFSPHEVSHGRLERALSDAGYPVAVGGGEG